VKKIVSLCMILSILLSMGLYIMPAHSAAASEKGGYTLVPMLYGKTGVDIASSFVLTTPAEISAEALAGVLSIDGQPAPNIAQNGAREFLITPAAALIPNSLYIFRLKRGEGADLTWAFQTAKKFQITSSYPRDEATNVPKNSGIEVTFSSDGYTKLDDYFSISPQVSGRFEYHKNTAVFVPTSLAYKTIYTVTIKAGIKLDGTSEELKEDYVFAFETEAAPEYKPIEQKPVEYFEQIFFYSEYIELPSIERPRVEYRLRFSDGYARPTPKVNVYKFTTEEQAVSAVQKVCAVPNWSRFAKEDKIIDTKSLRRVMSFDAVDTGESSYYETLELPDKLPQGFYLIDAALGDAHEQMIIQINDLPVQIVADGEKTIFWVNDILTGKASAGAKVYDTQDDKVYETDKNGVAVIDRAVPATENERFDITAANGKKAVWLYTSRYVNMYGGYVRNIDNPSEAYWTALQLDRTLFKRDDTVSFFGFVQDRKNGEEIENLTAVLTQGSRYGYYGTRDILHKQVVPVQNGTYTDEMKLPNLDAGSYNLTIYHGDIVLGSTYFTVQDYVKPPYKVELTADKKAAFAGETVTFTAKAGFFEGTPVSELDVSYNLRGAPWLETGGQGRAKTDIDGKVEIQQTIVPSTGAQGEKGLICTVEATLPEIGRTTKNASVRVFINDIDVKASAKRTDADATLNIDINTITLDRINNGTAKHYNDYIDKPVADKSVDVDIYRWYYIKEEAGAYYDYIEKKVVKRYMYIGKSEKIDSFSMTTNTDGTAEKHFTVPNRQYEGYYAMISCLDGNGRTITQKVYIGADYSYYYENANRDTYYLDSEKYVYDVGEQVNLTLKRGTETITKGNFLFVTMQSGILSYQAGANPYSFEFAKENVPNVAVNAYYFNGYNYQSSYYMNKNISFDYSKNNLSLTAVTDKESYKPGDTCNIIITAKDNNGNAKQADINISIVDEALFALRDYSVYTLSALYRNLSSGLRFETATHRAYVPSGDTKSGGGGGVSAPTGMANATPAPSESREESSIREVFKDTATFATVRTDERGEAVYSFKLPDNITSWRLTLSGITNDLYAGNGTQNIIVTNPMFLSYSLNDEFLLGDIPTIGVNVYGTSLSGGETVEFEVWDENLPAVKYTASGAAFERVNIPLWEMKTEGAGALIVQAKVSNGTSDAVKHQYQVLKTYREVDTAVYYDVTADTVFDVGNGGLTNIVFADRSRGAFLHQLLSMRYVYGDRIEKLVVRREANKIIANYFPDLVLYGSKDGFDIKPYQRADGGIAILPYADSDLETTVKLMPYIKDDVNAYALKNYLYGIYEGENNDNKMCALYGLAMLYEPVLLDLDNYALLDDIPIKDTVYIALGYYALGELETASELYDTRIAPQLEQVTPYYCVDTGADKNDILEATSAVAILATKLDKPEKDGLYQYCIANYATDILTNIEKLAHIETEIARRTDISGVIRYTLFGDEYTRELKNGSSYLLRIPAQSIAEFKLLEVTGDVVAVSISKKPMTDAGVIDNNITIRRRYYKGDEQTSSDTFNQGDIVRVQLWVDYSAKAIDGAYCITDYLPSGLEYVSNSAKISGAPHFGYGYSRYVSTEGQKINFYDYNTWFDRGFLYYYYARVVSPGTFKAEGTLVQNLKAKDYLTVGEDSVIVIDANLQ